MSSKAKEFGPVSRNGVRFGSGTYFNTNPANNRDEALRAEALKLGWANGCPQALALTRYDSKYSLDWMVKRYAETNYWYREALGIAKVYNPAVHQWLSTPRLRLLPAEPVGVHETLSVPKSHKWLILPMSGVEGYATPRVLIEILNLGGRNNFEAATEYMYSAMVSAGDEPDTFLARYTQMAASFGVKKTTLLRHIYSQGLLDEENCHTTYQNLAKRLDKYAPQVWAAYGSLGYREKIDLGIADVPTTRSMLTTP